LLEYEGFMEVLAVLDLSGARAAHLSWKRRLRTHLDGQNALSRSQLVSHSECDLGRWYHSEGLYHYGYLPEMRELAEPHAALHRLISTVVEHKEQGRHTDAEACYAQVEPLSQHIVNLLETIERKAAQSVSEDVRTRY
jgi:methyl-accepting chemotaxis protein